MNYQFPKPKEVAAHGLYSQPRLSKIKVKRDKCTLTVTSGRLDLEEASFPVNLSVNAISQCYRLHQPQSICINKNSKTDPEALTHLYLYGPPVADESTLRTEWRRGL